MEIFGFNISIWELIPAVGGGTILTYILLSLFAPHVLGVASEWLKAASPLIKGLAEGIVWFAHQFWEGFKDVIDNAATVLFVATVCALSVWYFQAPAKPCPTLTETPKCKQCIDALRKDYRFVPR